MIDDEVDKRMKAFERKMDKPKAQKMVTMNTEQMSTEIKSCESIEAVGVNTPQKRN